MNEWIIAGFLMLDEARRSTGRPRLAVVRQLRSHLQFMRDNEQGENPHLAPNGSDEVITELSRQADGLLATFYPTLRQLTVAEQVTVSGVIDGMLRNGPAHLREQVEAKAAGVFGDDIAARMVGRTGPHTANEQGDQ